MRNAIKAIFVFFFPILRKAVLEVVTAELTKMTYGEPRPYRNKRQTEEAVADDEPEPESAPYYAQPDYDNMSDEELHESLEDLRAKLTGQPRRNTQRLIEVVKRQDQRFPSVFDLIFVTEGDERHVMGTFGNDLWDEMAFEEFNGKRFCDAKLHMEAIAERKYGRNAIKRHKAEGYHDVLMVAFDISGMSAEEVHGWLQSKMPATGYDNQHDIDLDAWWIADDDAESDCDSAVFVAKGYQSDARMHLRDLKLTSDTIYRKGI